MSYLHPVAVMFSISVLFNGFHVGDSENPKAPRFVTLNGCKCQDLQCDCCAGVDLANRPHREVCLDIQVIPNEVTLKASIKVDGKNIYTGQLDPSVAPICPPPLGGICLSINHVNIQKRQVCTKLSLLVFTLVKFPCIGQENGQVVLEPNTYA